MLQLRLSLQRAVSILKQTAEHRGRFSVLTKTEKNDRIIRVMHNASCSKDKEQQLLTEEKKILVIQLLLGSGASIRQVSRLSSISFGIVRKYT